MSYKENLERALKLINEYCQKEFEEAANISDISDIGVAYTETEEGDKIEVKVDLLEYTLSTYVNDKLISQNRYDNLEDFIQNELAYLDFDSLVRLPDKEEEQERL